MNSEDQVLGFAPLASVVSQQQLIEATSIVGYQSNGHCLVIGSTEAALAACSELSTLKTTIVTVDAATETVTKNLTEDGVALYQAQTLKLSGHLGNYSAVAVAGVEELDLGVGVYLPDGLFDLVLDLSDTALLPAALLPFGYLHAPDDASLQLAIGELPALVGEFEKPKYFNYRADVCAHSRSDLGGCTNCVDVCAANAITSAGEGINVNPYLCQGCGSCATVCPSGALSYAYPRVSDAITRTRKLMSEKQACTALLLHSEDIQSTVDETKLSDNLLALAVEEVTAFGMDYWAAAVASGIQRVYLAFDKESPRNDRVAVEEQVMLFHTLMSGLGINEDIVRCIDSTQLAHIDVESSDSKLVNIEASAFVTHDDKRQTLRMAIDHLYEQLGAIVDVQPMPAEAAHGVVRVDDTACTLCMACVSVCPGKALLDGQESPALRMIEANCLQCGLCETACPESAITLQPQYRYDSIEARKINVLHEEEPFHCVKCHKAFASHKMISNMLGKLTNHWMFQDEKSMRRLKMCDDCRVKDIFEDNKDGIDVHKGAGTRQPS